MLKQIDWKGYISQSEMIDKLRVPVGTVGYQIDGKDYVPVVTPLSGLDRGLNRFLNAGVEEQIELVGLTSTNDELEVSITQTYEVGSVYVGRGRITLECLPQITIDNDNVRRRLTGREHIIIREAGGEGFVGI